MRTRWATSISSALAALAVSFAVPAFGRTGRETPPKPGSEIFAPPKLLTAGDKEMGSTLLYPSPALIDIDGDGTREMVIGGLRGYLMVCRRTKMGWGPEKRLKAADGKDLKFSNW